MKITIDFFSFSCYDIDAIEKIRKKKQPKGGESSESGRRVAADVRKIKGTTREVDGASKHPIRMDQSFSGTSIVCDHRRTIE